MTEQHCLCPEAPADLRKRIWRELATQSRTLPPGQMHEPRALGQGASQAERTTPVAEPCRCLCVLRGIWRRRSKMKLTGGATHSALSLQQVRIRCGLRASPLKASSCGVEGTKLVETSRRRGPCSRGGPHTRPQISVLRGRQGGERKQQVSLTRILK